MTDSPNPTNREKFLETYRKNLILAREKYPDQYHWPLSEIETVFHRMTVAIDRRIFNKDSHAFKWTCRELGIKHAYRAIHDFLKLPAEGEEK